MAPSGRWGLMGLALALGVGLAAVIVWRVTRPSAAELALEIRRALARGDAAEAGRLADRAVARFPRVVAVRVAAAEAALEQGDSAAALAHLDEVAYDGSVESLSAIGSAGDLLYQARRMQAAEERFRTVLRHAPENLTARRRLATVLALSGRREAQSLLLEIVREGQFDTHELALLGAPEQIFENPDIIRLFDDPDLDDTVLCRGAARYALHGHELTKALALYRRLLQSDPDDVDALAGYGRALVEAGTPAEFQEWHASLPPAADEHPEIWAARGRFAAARRETSVALRCFAEAVRRDPNHWLANQQLAVLLHQRGDAAGARPFAERSERLQSLAATLSLIHVDGTQTSLLLKAAGICEELGRVWEAWGWRQAAFSQSGREEDRLEAERLAETLDSDTPQTLPAIAATLRIDLAGLPLPDWTRAAADARPAAAGGSRWQGQITFSEDAPAAGIDFTYHSGDDPAEPGMMIFESSGGGVAVLDLDADGWPDLYLTQAGEWPSQPGQTDALDRGYRNLGDGTFADVTAPAGLGDDRYSQGATAGDFDGDGFADLYVGNIGGNRLYRNNGDGTFSDVSPACGLPQDLRWTTSVLIADLNGDALPELYDVTYVAGRLPYEHVCHDKLNQDAPRVCAPAVFEAEQDRLFLNRGDGRFDEIGAAAGIHAPEGKGLGIAAADLDGSGRLSLYVANDTTANFLFLNQTERPGDPPSFLEQATLAGCAVSSDGKGLASMGIAVDDADGDGLLELFITNFYKEYNNLYSLQPGGGFIDRSTEARLKEPSLDVLGFGTQFLDADLDGWPDLAVANGHVDDYTDNNMPFRMRAQFFANQGQGRFVELPPSQLGAYFQQPLLGRGMARLDWNRDGREDFAVSNLDTPASLVTNRTPETGHFLTIRLRGVQSSRDALGTRVEIEVGGRRRHKQLTAGDGYDSCNERQLVFGLGEATVVPELTVRWPSGQAQTFMHLAADRELLIIEGRHEPLTVPR